MTRTTDTSIIVVKHLPAGTVTSYAGRGSYLHIERSVENVSTILTEANGNTYSIVDATIATAGSITVRMPLELGINKFKLMDTSNTDLNIGDIDMTVIGRDAIQRIVSQTSITI